MQNKKNTLKNWLQNNVKNIIAQSIMYSCLLLTVMNGLQGCKKSNTNPLQTNPTKKDNEESKVKKKPNKKPLQTNPTKKDNEENKVKKKPNKKPLQTNPTKKDNEESKVKKKSNKKPLQTNPTRKDNEESNLEETIKSKMNTIYSEIENSTKKSMYKVNTENFIQDIKSELSIKDKKKDSEIITFMQSYQKEQNKNKSRKGQKISWEGIKKLS